MMPELSGDSGVTTYCKDVTVESVCSLFEIADGSCGQSDPDGDVAFDVFQAIADGARGQSDLDGNVASPPTTKT